MDINKVRTLKDLAKITGFTESTISRVLNGLGDQYRITEATQQIIKKKAAEANYSINENARGLRLKKTFTIGLIIPDISNPFFAKMASFIEKEARLHDYSIFLCNSDNSMKVEKKSVLLLQKRKVDGVIVSPAGTEQNHLLELYSETPLLLIDRYFANANIPYVTIDDYEGTFKAIKHLIDSGHKRIACIQGLEGISSNINRVNGYKNAMLSSGLKINERMIIGNAYTEENGYVSAKLLLSMPDYERPTVIFSSSDIITLGVLKAFEEENIIVPDDISILSFDEQSYSNFLASPMTTIAQPIEEMGKLAFKMLLEQIESSNKSGQESVFLPTKLIFRKSIRAIS